MLKVYKNFHSYFFKKSIKTNKKNYSSFKDWANFLPKS